MSLPPIACRPVPQANTGASFWPVFQGFALELDGNMTSTALLSSVAGLLKLESLLSTSKTLVMRRCNMLSWTAGRAMSPLHVLDVPQNWTAIQLRAEVELLRKQDAALLAVVASSGASWRTCLWESLHEGYHSRAARSQLISFLGLQGTSFVGDVAFRGEPPGWKTFIANGEELLKQDNSSWMLADEGCAAGAASPHSTCTPRQGTECSVAEAMATLASMPRRIPPLLAVGTHGREGGASLIVKVISQACRLHPDSVLGRQCAFRDDYETCDPDDVDVCVHSQARFSAGRFADRGYRFVHVVRSPLDMLTRSYLLAQPNATRIYNSSQLVAALEAQWKVLAGSVLHEMIDTYESYLVDPLTLSVKMEDLISESLGNATLMRTLAFLLDRSPTDSTVQALFVPLSHTLAVQARMEHQGEAQRKHLAKLFMHKPAKCVHANKLQQSLNYEVFHCGDVPKPHSIRRRRLRSLRWTI